MERTGKSDVAANRGDRPAPTVAFVTVSYGPDRDRCGLLCRSIDALAPATWDHVIIVDRADIPKFRELESGRRHIVATEDVLPKRVWRLEARRVGLRSNVFVHAGLPVRGWLVQQLVKLAICREIEADVVVHADSDVVLVRGFDAESVVDGAHCVRLYCAPGAIDASLSGHVRWHRTAERLLGLDASPTPLPDYITSLVPWRRDNAKLLLDFLDRRFRRSWMRVISNAWDFSEYILYGRFVSEVVGDVGGQFASASSLCRDYWGHEALSNAELENFLDGMSEGHVAVSITAKAGMNPDSYASVLERRWVLARRGRGSVEPSHRTRTPNSLDTTT